MYTHVLCILFSHLIGLPLFFVLGVAHFRLSTFLPKQVLVSDRVGGVAAPTPVPEVTAPQLRCSRCSMQEPESNIRQHLDNESVRAEERVASQGLGDRGERRTTWGQTISRTHART